MQSAPLPFHPAVRDWFAATFAGATPVQLQAWPAIRSGSDVLIAAPTGSGKTLAAFLAAIDDLVRESANGPLPDETRVVYVSPLKALSNDIECNLQQPLVGIAQRMHRLGLTPGEIRTWVRTGDTPVAERNRARRKPPHIVVTTPESLYILLTSASGRAMLATTRTVIVDEIHALAPNKRGAHLALSLERLDALAGRRIARIGLSATQKPIEDVARFLVGVRTAADGASGCTIIDTGHTRPRDLALELPPTPLEAVMSADVWSQVYDRLAALIAEHRTTLVFVNTRRLAERAARHLSERLGEAFVTSHHGSLAREQRLDAEQRLKRGSLKALVATASLELGIDIGDVDLVCQLGSPHSISAFLQRVGRSGHAVGGTPKGRLFPLSRDDLVECAALLDSVRRRELDCLRIPPQPLDVLAQQIVAEVSQQEWREDELYELVRRSYPYRALARETYGEVVRMLSEGFHTRLGRRSAHLHRDLVNGTLRERRGAALAAVTSGGTIPDTADYTVVLEPQSQTVGSVNEDFAIESLAGDVFQLGNVSYRILRVERGTVRVEDAKGALPGIPFWLGEAPARTEALSDSVMRLNAHVAELMARTDAATAARALASECGLAASAAEQITDYLGAAYRALGALPGRDTVILERFFDESGGMQLIVHAPFGGRINRAWGLALRKRFCRKFNFELQAAAIEDAIVLSLSTSHSFELADVARYLSSKTVRALLVQAVLDAPMFATRWRWNAVVALALLRFRGGTKVPAQLARMQSEDLLATVFPDQVACGENIVGDREIPDHPLVYQTLEDCLHDAMDIDGLEQVLSRIESGEIRVVARDLTEPSPLAMEILSAKPYAFLDDAPLEERRTQAVLSRRWHDPQATGDLGKLDAAAIGKVRAEAWPQPRDPDELHDALVELGFLTPTELGAIDVGAAWFETLVEARRAATVSLNEHEAATFHVAVERLPEFRALFPSAAEVPRLEVPEACLRRDWQPDTALLELLRDRLGSLGPQTLAALHASLPVGVRNLEAALANLESEGTVLRGTYTPSETATEWCDRRLLARIHRYTVNRLRQEIEPVVLRDFMVFLLRWQHADAASRREGPDAVAAVISQLEGFEAPAAAWETEILPARIDHYDPAWLDELCLAGRVTWARLSAGKTAGERVASPVKTSPIALFTRRNLAHWMSLAPPSENAAASAPAQAVHAVLQREGALFFDEIVAASRLLPTQAEAALGELVSLGRVNADGFIGLRALLLPSDRRRTSANGRRRRRTALFGIEDAGRWALVRKPAARDADAAGDDSAATLELVARTLLRRYGVVFWRLLEREPAWLPPWRELLRIFRRLEARGEIRGGRFVAGISGEQFALPDAVNALRDTRRREREEERLSLSAADPLNLAGIVTPGARVPALTTNRVLYEAGIAVAAQIGGQMRLLAECDAGTAWAREKALVRRHVPPELAMFE